MYDVAWVVLEVAAFLPWWSVSPLPDTVTSPAQRPSL